MPTLPTLKEMARRLLSQLSHVARTARTGCFVFDGVVGPLLRLCRRNCGDLCVKAASQVAQFFSSDLSLSWGFSATGVQRVRPSICRFKNSAIGDDEEQGALSTYSGGSAASMSRQRLKIFAAGVILAVGFAVALVFFRQVGGQRQGAAAKTTDVVLRQSFDPRAEDDGATPHLSGRIEPATAVPVASAPAAQAAPALPPPVAATPASIAPSPNAPLATTPPTMAEDFQSAMPTGEAAGFPTDPFQVAGERPAPAPRRKPGQPQYRRHVIRDGDTLAGLAERYLGSSSRKAEILALNRDTLRVSDELPIGAVLRIPAGSAKPAMSVAPIAAPTLTPAPALAPDEEPLVPVPLPEPAAAPVVSASISEPETPPALPTDDGWRSAPSAP
jgi:hypothetical protein